MFSPSRVVALLVQQFGVDPDPSSATREERKIVGLFAHLIREAHLGSLLYETYEEISMTEPEDDNEESDPTWSCDDLDIVNDLPPSDKALFHFSRGSATMEMIKKAAKYYRSTTDKAHRSLSKMMTDFRFIRNEWYIRKMEKFAKEDDKNSTRRMNRVMGLQRLSDDLLKEVQEAFSEVLQEPGGAFPRKKKIFSAPNLFVSAGSSHIMTKGHMKEWINNCIFTHSTPSDDLLILLDSWTSFRDSAAIASSVPQGKTLETRQIPAGATGFCQPLDVYFFRPFKGVVRRIHSYAFRNHPEFMVYQRDSILKVISLSYSIMSCPCFRPLIQYAWYRAGYLDSAPATRFKTPVQVCFHRSVYSTQCSTVNCTAMSFILCPKCQNALCFKCFVINFHSC